MARRHNLWRGYPKYKSFHGSLVADTEVELAAPAGELFSSVRVRYVDDSELGSMWVTFEGTTPAQDGLGDTNNVMVELRNADGPVNFPLACTKVSLISSTAAKYQVVATY